MTAEQYKRLMNWWLITGVIYGSTIMINWFWYRCFGYIHSNGLLLALVAGIGFACVTVASIAASVVQIVRKSNGD